MGRAFALAVALATAAEAASAACVRPSPAPTNWPATRSPRLPGVTLRLPAEFTRDTSGESSLRRPAPRGSRWTGPGNAQVSVFLVDSGGGRFATELPGRAAGRAEFSRCEERVGDGRLTVASYNQREAVGDMAFIGPYQVFAIYHSPEQMAVHLYASTESRQVFAQLLAAVRTLRVHRR